ncbi:uncharacterized protein BDV17DRAFT_165990 [Aspergillus undulatus]|uniref:uncharacterized protein n=1 Tax=Aspergillus undulatus TaxID=1810928 RepID=UPI003CCD7843
MSGVEVVGILLGAIPLVVSALKAYKESKQRYIWFMSKEPHIDRLIQSLNEQIYFIRSDVDVALRSTDLEQDKIKTFLSDPDLDLLRDREVADAIQDYLGEGFQLYLSALARCQGTICHIVQNLNGLVSSGRRIESTDLTAIVRSTPKTNGDFDFHKKIKFSLQKEDIDAQIASLEASAKILGRINKQSTRREAVTVQSTSRTITKFTSALASVRGSAHRLYSAISQGYLHTCHDQHEVQLFLQTRSALLEGKKPRMLRKPPVVFEVALCAGKDTLWNQDAWSYKTEIQVIEEDDNDDEDDGPNPALPSPRPVVTFNLPNPVTTTAPGLVHIHNLCSLVSSRHGRGASVDICLLGSGKLCSIARPPRTRPTSLQTTDISGSSPLTLTALLTGSHANIPPIPLNHRIALSYNIALAVLQLHSTPWLPLPLTSSSIFFIPETYTKENKRPTQSPKYLPFIKATFHNCRPTCAMPHHNTRESMLELGILLLELWHAQPIEEFAENHGLKLFPSFGSRYEVAQEWVTYSEDEGDMMPFYLEAATRCIECTFTTSAARPDWNDFTFQKSVCQYLLKPLLDNCPARYR